MAWQININSDSTIVSLDLKKLTAADNLSYDDIAVALQENEIPVNEDLKIRIHEILEQLTEPGTPDRMPTLVQAIPHVDGQDGRFEWSEKCDPEKHKAPEIDPLASDRASFYHRSTLIVVDKNDVLGVLHPPTNGQEGTDIFGKSIPAQPVEDFKIEPGENVQLLAEGKTFVAQCDGEPKLEGTTLSVDPVLTINSEVDFATGNVCYSGDIIIKGDIKDLFEVRTGGNITVEGTIESAQVECAGSLTIQRGVCGKNKGKLQVQKDLSVKFLSNVSAWIQGNALVESEIVNVNLNCRGQVVLQNGAIHGGQVTAAGNIETPIIGSPASVRTVIKAAMDPYLEREINELNAERAQLADKIVFLMPHAKKLLQISQGQLNDKLKKMTANISKSNQQIKEIDQKLESLHQEIAETCNGIIIVHKTIYPGSVLYVGSAKQIIYHEISGPMKITVNRSTQLGPQLSFCSPHETEVTTS